MGNAPGSTSQSIGENNGPVRRRADEHALYSVEWATPPEIFDPLNAEFGFTLDPASSPWNAKAPTFYTAEDDGLSKPWAPHTVWLNPPYGRGIGLWLAKAVAEAKVGATVVALIPNNTDTAWFHDHVLPFAELRWVRGRVQFIGADGRRRKGNTTGSVIAVYRPGVRHAA